MLILLFKAKGRTIKSTKTAKCTGLKVDRWSINLLLFNYASTKFLILIIVQLLSSHSWIIAHPALRAVYNKAQVLWKTLAWSCLPAGRDDSCYNTCSSCLTLSTMKHCVASIQHCTYTFANTNKDVTAWSFKTNGFLIWSWERTRSLHMSYVKRIKTHLAVFYCSSVHMQAAVWNPNDLVLYLLVKGISYFLTITLKGVKRNNNYNHTL